MEDISLNFYNNDLQLVSDDDDMYESCIRRLNCFKGETEIYEEYGSELKTLLGLKKTDVNLTLIEQEVANCLSQDSRIEDIDVEAEFTLDKLIINVKISYSENEELEFTYEPEED